MSGLFNGKSGIPGLPNPSNPFSIPNPFSSHPLAVIGGDRSRPAQPQQEQRRQQPAPLVGAPKGGATLATLGRASATPTILSAKSDAGFG